LKEENAIPSVNLPMKTFSQKTNENSYKGRKRQMLKEESDVTNYTTSDLCEDERNAVDNLLNLGSVLVNFQQNYHIEDKGVQVTSGDLVTLEVAQRSKFDRFR
jgi:hypothetical protein